MSFDPCPHQITQIILKAGAVIRELKGLPVEKNITVLKRETAALLGVEINLTSGKAAHLPSPAETTDRKGKILIPKKDCFGCGKKESMVLFSLCSTCADAEGGKYKSKWECLKCGKKEIYEMPLVKWLDVLGVEFKGGFKKELGIKTATDDGVK